MKNNRNQERTVRMERSLELEGLSIRQCRSVEPYGQPSLISDVIGQKKWLYPALPLLYLFFYLSFIGIQSFCVNKQLFVLILVV